SWGGLLVQEYAVKYGHHLKGAIISSMVDEIDEYVDAVNRRRQEILPQSEIAFMHKCEHKNDYDNERYQEDVNILNINFVDRKQPSKLYHLKDIGGSDVYHTFQGDNEFVITGKLKEWHFRDQLQNIKVPTLITFGESETMPIATAKIMQKKIPNARLVTTPDGGHHHMVDNPNVYYKHLADFIRQVEDGSFRGK
ncbi:prolyl aminopeptidase, partial [Lactobacillus sp. XV13L]|nr:prolyl aminopeptidase [Lactobacillus sp. XV13L]